MNPRLQIRDSLFAASVFLSATAPGCDTTTQAVHVYDLPWDLLPKTYTARY